MSPDPRHDTSHGTSSDELPIPPWVLVWGAFVAAALFVPVRHVRRFVVDPLIARAVRDLHLAPDRLEDMQQLFAGFVHVAAVGFALLYLLVRALTARWRRDAEDGRRC